VGAEIAIETETGKVDETEVAVEAEIGIGEIGIETEAGDSDKFVFLTCPCSFITLTPTFFSLLATTSGSKVIDRSTT